MIDRITFFDHYALQVVTSIECIAADACHTVRNHNACQTVAVIECPISDACTSGDYHLFQCFGDITTIERITRRTKDIAKMRLSAAIRFLADKRDSDASQTITSVECIIADACHAVGNHYACQTAAAVECTAADACHAVPNRDTCQTAAIRECILADACYTVRDYDACQAVYITVERTIADARYGFASVCGGYHYISACQYVGNGIGIGLFDISKLKQVITRRLGLISANLAIEVFVIIMRCVIPLLVMSTCRGMPMSAAIIAPLVGIAVPICRNSYPIELLRTILIGIIKTAYRAMPILNVALRCTSRTHCIGMRHIMLHLGRAHFRQLVCAGFVRIVLAAHRAMPMLNMAVIHARSVNRCNMRHIVRNFRNSHFRQLVCAGFVRIVLAAHRAIPIFYVTL